MKKNREDSAHGRSLDRILVAEDDAEMRSLLADALRDDGYRVVEAVDGREAVMRLVEETFDVVITDLRMPHLGGFDVLEVARRAEGAPPVIVISAFGQWDALRESAERGAFRFLSKPLKISELRDAVNEALGGQGK